MDKGDLGAETCSRASMEPSFTVSTLAGFDQGESLIARLEVAPGVARELDADIAEALGLFPALFKRRANRGSPGWFGKSGHSWFAQPYTASLDAAVSLVPEGMEWRIDSHHSIAGVFDYPFDPESGPYCMEYSGESATPALALCVAALKARAAIVD